MAKSEENGQGAGSHKADVRAASEELARSFWRLGRSVAAAPMRLLPAETRHHLRAAGREAVHAGIALNREVLDRSENRLADAQARLNELEEGLAELDE